MSNFNNIQVMPMTISDHHCVVAEINLDLPPRLGRPNWKLNTKLLELRNIENEFKVIWDRLCTFKKGYNNINGWWDSCAKRE